MSLIERLSIIIVTWRGNDLLRNCLNSLNAVHGTTPEVIVVDNGNEKSCRELCAEYPNVNYLASPENLGFAGGNNLGLAKATREFILLLNNDTIVHEDSFSPLIEFLVEHDEVGIVQGTMNVPALGDGLDDCGTLMTPFGIQIHRLRGKPTATTKLCPRRVFAAKGAMMMFKRKVLEDTGFLFYDHFKSYYEETDFCHRAKLKGWESWFVPTPPIDHLVGQTSSRLDREEVWTQYFRNILFSFHQNFGVFGHVFTIPCFIIAAFIRSPKALLRAVRSIAAS